MRDHLFQKNDQITSRYKIKSFIAEGGMQQVFLAFDKRLKRTVALKTPINNSGEKRFKKSAELSARVTHPNAAKTLDYFSWEDRQFLIEEYIEGMNLRDRYDKDFDFLDPYFSCYLIHRIARGVAASHHRDVFHRDLKPSNIMVSNEPLPEVVKITDFGIAKLAQEEIDKAMKTEDVNEKTLAIEASKTVKGAFPYMAPELLQQDSPSLPADVWAIGAIGYELLTGKKPFGEGTKAITKIVTGQKPDKPKFENANLQFSRVGDDLLNVLYKCFIFEPNQRITADQLVREMGDICYSTLPRREGTVNYYGHGQKRIGFINDEDGKSVFFHRDSYYGKPEVRSRVSFADFPGNPHDRAHPVLPLKNVEEEDTFDF